MLPILVFLASMLVALVSSGASAWAQTKAVPIASAPASATGAPLQQIAVGQHRAVRGQLDTVPALAAIAPGSAAAAALPGARGDTRPARASRNVGA